MSILLEALKKSEEQRQIGKAPDIHDPADHKPDWDNGKTSVWMTAAMLAVAGIAVSWLVWVQYDRPAASALSGAPEVSQRPASEASTGAEQVKAERPIRAPGVSARAQAQPPAGADGAAAAAASRRQELARDYSQFTQPEATESAEPADTSEAEPQDRSGQPGNAAASGAEDLAENVRQAAPPAATPEQSEPGPVSYWELPQNVRDSMPELRITVMVYADEPADRFMLLNGQRVVEQETIEGVKLEEIRRDGAVFRYRNYRFLVKG